MKKFVLLLCLACSQATAANWKRVGATDGNAAVEIDAESLNRSADMVTAWERIVHDRPQALPDRKQYSVRQNLIAVDCRNRSIRIDRTVFFDDKGGMVDMADNDKARPRVVRPDSIGNAVVRFSCAR
jgi:hypothetical protein